MPGAMHCLTRSVVGAAFAGLDATRQRTLTGELLELVARFNRAKDGTLVLDAEYLEAMIVRR